MTLLSTLARRLGNAAADRYSLLLIFLWGTTVRILYFAVTPHLIRTYDTPQHIDYIVYVLRNFSIPPSASGWEMHQPPVYYFLAAFWTKLIEWMGRSPEALPANLQWLSLLLSIATLAVIVWIGMILFPKKEQRPQAMLFGLVVGTLPGIAMSASRINNDSLSFLVSFLWLAVALRWWKSGQAADFWLAAVITGTALLIKFTAGVVLLPMLILVLVHRQTPPKKRLLLATGVLCTVALLSGWYFAFRSIEYFDRFLPGGSKDLNEFLFIQNHVLDFLIFNPLAVLQMPFANPWDAFSGRENIWEFLFRSAFFGEWTFARLVWLGRLIIATALLGIVPAVAGIIRGWRRDVFFLPLAILAASLLLMLSMYRIGFPCACNQDFRLVPLLSIPFAAWTIAGFFGYGKPGQRWALLWALSLATLQSLFLLSFLVMA